MNSFSQKSSSQLTPQGLYSLLDCQEKGVILQVHSAELLPAKKPGADSLKYKIVISDGSAKQKAVFGNRAAFVFQKAGAPSPCIIRVDDIIQLNVNSPKRLVIITEMEILNSHSNHIIGFPVDYQTWSSQNSFTENGATQILNLNTQTISSVNNTQINTQANTQPVVNIMEGIFPGEEPSSKKSSPFQIIKEPRQQKLDFQKLASQQSQDKVNIYTIFNPSPEVKKSQDILNTSNSGTCSTAKSESDLPAQRAVKQINSVSAMGMQLRDFDVEELNDFNKSADNNQVFVVEFYDKDGSKMSAAFYGQNAEYFMQLFNGSGTHIVKNLGSRMDL